jgi:hypothetical protein
MAENEYNSNSGGNDTRNPRPNLPRTRSVAGPRPLPGGSKNYPKELKNQHQRQYSNSNDPEYCYVPPQNSNPQNFIQPEQTVSTSDQPFPPLISPKPQKPMPTVTNDIANALETQYSESLNGYEITTSDTPKSWYKGDDENLNLASDQNQVPSLQSNTELQSNIAKELQQDTNDSPSHDNRQNINNQYSGSPQKQLNQQWQQQQQQMYYQNFSPTNQQNYNNFQHDEQAMTPNGNFQSERTYCKSFKIDFRDEKLI